MGKDYCAIYLCHNFTGKVGRFGKKVKLHSLPKDPNLRSGWIRAISRKNFLPNRNTFVCSDHFPDGNGRTWKYTVPTLHLPQKRLTPSKTRATRNSRSLNSSRDLCDDDLDGTPKCKETDQSEDKDDTDVSNLDHCYFSYSDNNENVVQQEPSEKVKSTSNSFSNDKAFSSNQVPTVQQEPEITMSKIADKDVPFYTGLPNRYTFNSLLDTCIKHGVQDHLKSTRNTKLTLENELLLTLMRLRMGLLLKDLSYRFHISESQTSRIFRGWIIYLYAALQSVVFIPKFNSTNTYIPDCFKSFPDTKIILDCTEIFVETPSSLENKSLVYSNYKSHSTFKALIGINMVGAVVLVSKLYGGCTSDVEITHKSGLYDHLNKGDAVMADKGFLFIRPDLTKLGVKVYAPPMNSKGQLSKDEVILTRRIACARIHVERKMEQIKNFRIMNGVLPLRLSSTADEIFFVCSALTNFLPPLVK